MKLVDSYLDVRTNCGVVGDLIVQNWAIVVHTKTVKLFLFDESLNEGAEGWLEVREKESVSPCVVPPHTLYAPFLCLQSACASAVTHSVHEASIFIRFTSASCTWSCFSVCLRDLLFFFISFFTVFLVFFIFCVYRKRTKLTPQLCEAKLPKSQESDTYSYPSPTFQSVSPVLSLQFIKKQFNTLASGKIESYRTSIVFFSSLSFISMGTMKSVFKDWLCWQESLCSWMAAVDVASPNSPSHQNSRSCVGGWLPCLAYNCLQVFVWHNDITVWSVVGMIAGIPIFLTAPGRFADFAPADSIKP